MSEKKYNEYFTIDKNFKPCMSKDGINETPDYWMNFYPHESFVEFFHSVLNSLAGGEKTVWLAAPYGTGKSHAVLVLQKLITDDSSRVQKWLDDCKTLIPDSLCQALWTLRKQNPLVVYDCGSDALTNPNLFLVRLQQSIIEALKEKNCVIPALGQLDAYLERIREEGVNFFNTRDAMQGELTHLSPNIKNIDDLEKQIAKPKLREGLVNDIMLVFEKRGIYINLTVDNFLKWVSETIAANHLSKILYIWDEFSTYVDQNRSQLTTFQEVANAAMQGQFYLLPVTHMKLESYVADGSDSAKKVSGRFYFRSLSMPTNTALELAAHVFKIIPGQDDAWDFERQKLWNSVKNIVINYMAEKDDECKRDPEKFKYVLPIHPMAAFMLKFLATMVGSNQRSMFNFLKGDNMHTEFQDFMAQGGPLEEGKQLLTVDYLWSYFIERDDLGLSGEISKIRMEFNRKSKTLDAKEIRVFKAVLLYSLLDSLTSSSGHELIQPTIENIDQCFRGSDILNIPEYIDQLEKKHCFSILNGRCYTFRGDPNSEDTEKLKREILGDFKKYVCDPDANNPDETKLTKSLETRIKQNNQDKLHFIVRCSSPAKAPQSFANNKDPYGPDGNKALVQFIIAQDAIEHNKAAEIAKSLAYQYRGFRMLFVITPDIHFCTFNQNNWEEYADQRAHAGRANDTASKDAYNRQASNILESWKERLFDSTQRLQIISCTPEGEINVVEKQWSTINAWLQTYLRSQFDSFLDDLSEYNTSVMSENVNGAKALTSWAKAGLLKDGVGMYKNVLKSLNNKNIAATSEWFEANPSSPLTKLRNFCAKKLDNALGGSGYCSIRKILDELVKPPFGLLYIPFTAFIMGVAMNEWLNPSRRQLQWTDKIDSDPLDADTLASMIGEAISDRGNNAIKNEKFVCRVSREEKAFIDATPDMFGIENDPKASINAVLNNIANRLEQISNKAPLWTLKEYIPQHEEPHTAKLITEILDQLCQAITISSKSDPKNNKVALIKSIGSKIKSNEGIAKRIRNYIDAEVFDKAFKQYIDKAKPELQAIALETGDNSNQYCQSIKDRCAETASWLWSARDINIEIDAAFAQYKIIQIVQQLIGQSAFISFESAKNRLNKAFYIDNRISLAVLSGDYPAVNDITTLFNNSGVSDGVVLFAQSLGSNQQLVKDLFFDPKHSIQITTLKNLFKPQLETLGESDIEKIYDRLGNQARLPEDVFRQTTSQIIDEYLKESVATSLSELWKEKTGSSDPLQWSISHRLPINILFDADEEAAEMVHILQAPSAYQSDRLKAALQRLQEINFISDENQLQSKYLKMILPTKYQKLNVSANELLEFLSNNISNNPNLWQQNAKILIDNIDAFIHKSYKKTFCDQAVNIANGIDANQAKSMLIDFIKQYPDVGLKVLEDANER